MAHHLIQDLGLQSNSLVFLHPGLRELGIIEKGKRTITAAFSEVLPDGILVVPSFTYSWCKGESFDREKTECPRDLGGYASTVWKDKGFVRSGNPNFSVAALENNHNRKTINEMFQIGTSCFGKDSIFEKMYELSKTREGYIILLGGAHNDALFRSTFIHFVEEKVGVPNRYLKKFYNPDNESEYVEQLVRFISEDEYRTITGRENEKYRFPITPDYSLLGEDLKKNGIITIKPFGYGNTRMVHIKQFCDFLELKLKNNPDYCVLGSVDI